MIFAGDVAWPWPGLSHEGYPPEEVFVFNCEGYVVDDGSTSNEGVYNNLRALRALPGSRAIGVIANNHILDRPGGASTSRKLAAEAGIPLVGAGKDLEEAEEPYVLEEAGEEVALLCAGWYVIGCVEAGVDREGVAPLDEQRLVEQIGTQKRMGRKVVLYVHWGYELEAYPHPAHRDLAMRFIDAGADLVVGAHAHRIQGHETYMGKHIFYGLGNAIFEQSHYYEGRLRFPDVCRTGLVVSWSPATGETKVANVSVREDVASFHDWSEVEGNERLMDLSKFAALSSRDYIDFFGSHRVKRRALPIFIGAGTSLDSRLKARFVRWRGAVISLAFRSGLLGY